MDNEVLIEARSVSRRYGPTTAVDNLNLTLRKGEVLGLLGPNGAGKSTTMKMLTGNLAPSSGEILIRGQSLRESPKDAKRALGYLPEQPPVYPELTVDEYLDYCAGLHGLGRKQRPEAVAGAKRDCGLSEVSRRLIGNLSKGYQQRVGLAQAIIHRPAVIVLDEPTVGLDPIQIREIRGLIAGLAQNHSLILSSHILPEIQMVCSRVMIINRGRVVYNEPLDAASAHRVETIALQCRRSADETVLRAVSGVRSVAALTDNRYRIQCEPGSDPREALADAVARGGWGLIELHAQMHNLEEMFVSLTSGGASEELREAA